MLKNQRFKVFDFSSLSFFLKLCILALNIDLLQFFFFFLVKPLKSLGSAPNYVEIRSFTMRSLLAPVRIIIIVNYFSLEKFF
jgi:hypothetical protein